MWIGKLSMHGHLYSPGGALKDGWHYVHNCGVVYYDISRAFCLSEGSRA
jgi:hypothetical protein